MYKLYKDKGKNDEEIKLIKEKRGEGRKKNLQAKIKTQTNDVNKEINRYL